MSPMANSASMSDKNRSFISSEIIAGIALIVTIFGSAQGWLILPEKVRSQSERTDRLEHKVNSIEALASERAETLARIDERTKRIEAVLQEERTR
jgi:hypothetical protein